MVVEEETVLTKKRVLYIGSSETTDDPSGLAAVQKPLRERYRSSDHNTPGIDANLTVYPSGLKLQYTKDPETTVFFPIKYLKLSAAVRCVETTNSLNGEKIPTFISVNNPAAGGGNSRKPAIFTVISRRTKGRTGYDCHGFITEGDQDALELVRNSAFAEKNQGLYGTGVQREDFERPDQGFFYKGKNTQIRPYTLEHGVQQMQQMTTEQTPTMPMPMPMPQAGRPVTFLGPPPPQVVYVRPPPPPPPPPRPPTPPPPAPIIIRPIIRIPPPQPPPPQPRPQIIVRPIMPPPQPARPIIVRPPPPPNVYIRPPALPPVVVKTPAQRPPVIVHEQPRPIIMAPPPPEPKSTPRIVVMEEEKPPPPREIPAVMERPRPRSPSPRYVLQRPVEQRAIMPRPRSVSPRNKEYRFIPDPPQQQRYSRREEFYSRPRKGYASSDAGAYKTSYHYPAAPQGRVVYQRNSSVPQKLSGSYEIRHQDRRGRSSSSSPDRSPGRQSKFRIPRAQYATGADYRTSNVYTGYTSGGHERQEIVNGRYIQREADRTKSIPLAFNGNQEDLVVMSPGYNTEVYPVGNMNEAVHVVVEKSPDYDTYHQRHQPTSIIYESRIGRSARVKPRSRSSSSSASYGS